MPGVSGVGVSFGADRIYDVMSSLELFTEHTAGDKSVMLVNFGGDEEKYSISILNLLRDNGICAELYPDPAKVKKQLAFANARGIEYVGIAGEEERSKGLITLKNMITGEQESLSPPELLKRLG